MSTAHKMNSLFIINREIIFYKDLKQNMSLKLRDPLYEILKSYVEPKILSTLGGECLGSD